MQLIKMKSLLPMTDYAPSWNFTLGITKWNDSEKLKNLRSFLLKKETEIINSHTVNNDGGTGLGTDSVTSRFGNYNLFDFTNESAELQDFLTFLRTSYLEFVEEDRTPIKNLNIVCWYNVIRNEQKITIHNHNSANYAYLSGNMHLGDYDTQTTYRNPYDPSDQRVFPNVEGGLTIFPSALPHFANKYTGNDVRISIAFDLHIETYVPGTINFLNENPHLPKSQEYFRWQQQRSLRALPFMSDEILQELYNNTKQQQGLINDIHSS